jgi:GT2 family glycosyltransferase
MSDPAQPAMSVVLVTPDCYQTIARTVALLGAQSAADQLELIVVAPDVRSLDLPDTERRRFAAVRLVEAGQEKRYAAAHAAGVRAATTPVVAFAEDHAFPAPGWADALIAAHRGSWAVVGPAMRNANPDTRTSWADFLLGYGRWQEPIQGGPTDHVPGHNSSYKRAALMSYGEKLEDYLQAPALLHADLAARGYRLYLEPAAVVAHSNFSSIALWLPGRFHAGRAFAGARARDWRLRRRVLYVLAIPLIPFVRLARIARETHRDGQPAGFFLRIAPLLWFGLVLDALGELTGYACGAPGSYEREWDWEFHRERQA